MARQQVVVRLKLKPAQRLRLEDGRMLMTDREAGSKRNQPAFVA
jgi:hypothetical protein